MLLRLVTGANLREECMWYQLREVTRDRAMFV